jgi:hypothetical protein
MQQPEHRDVDRGALCTSILLWGTLALWSLILLLFWVPMLRAAFFS